MLQCLPLEHLHDDVVLGAIGTFGRSDVVNGADVRMIESRRGTCLALKTLDGLWIRRQFARQELQCHPSTQSRVIGGVDHTHATAAEALDDVVVGDRLTNHDWRDPTLEAAWRGDKQQPEFGAARPAAVVPAPRELASRVNF